MGSNYLTGTLPPEIGHITDSIKFAIISMGHCLELGKLDKLSPAHMQHTSTWTARDAIHIQANKHIIATQPLTWKGY
ncbi:hypothetical protein I3760_06G178400 [Carya illinoinensis]|nr:hypothetical protein I3760_06G178400 [Carya illinoinensis]